MVPAASKESWTYQTQYFKGSLALDLPGHPHGDRIPSIEGYVEWLRNFIQSAGYRQVVLVGHSLGGGIALLYALKYPQDLEAIITVGSGARLRVHPQFLADLEKAIKDPGIENALNTNYDLIKPDLADVLKRRMKENGPAVSLNDMKACDQFDIMGQISQIKHSHSGLVRGPGHKDPAQVFPVSGRPYAPGQSPGYSRRHPYGFCRKTRGDQPGHRRFSSNPGQVVPIWKTKFS